MPDPSSLFAALEFAAAQSEPHFVSEEAEGLVVVRDVNGTFVNVAIVDANGVVVPV